MAQGKALTRAVSVGEPSEHYLFYPLYKPLLFRRIARLVTAPDVRAVIIQIGVRKNSRDWPPRLWERFSRYDYILTTDWWSGFDTSIPPELLLRLAWDVLLKAVDLHREEDRVSLLQI